MKDLFEWFIQMEHLAGSLYLRLAHIYQNDPEFSRFLLSLAKDEDRHLEQIRKAEQEFLRLKKPPSADILFDKETRTKLEAPARELYELMSSCPEISKETALKLIVKIEFSEWNSLFLYAATAVGERNTTSRQMLEDIQSHKNEIEKFIKSHPDVDELLKLIRNMPKIGKDRLLIVEDKTALRVFLGQMLESTGHIETAVNGEEALEKIRDSFFDIIISNIDIPKLNGVDLIYRAVEKGHMIGEKFLLYSRKVTPEIEKLITDHKPQFLKLPFGTNQLHDKIRNILKSGKGSH